MVYVSRVWVSFSRLFLNFSKRRIFLGLFLFKGDLEEEDLAIEDFLAGVIDFLEGVCARFMFRELYT